MNDTTKTAFDQLTSSDKEIQTQAFFSIMAETEQPVDWAYEVWDGLVADLRHKDNRRRAIASQILCNLAQSDPENRMLSDFPALLHVTRDERFVTARHCLQAIWKVGVVGQPQQQLVMDGLAGRYAECATEKNTTLIRYDIVDDLRKLYDVVGDDLIRTLALALIESEEDLKYRKKYANSLARSIEPLSQNTVGVA